MLQLRFLASNKAMKSLEGIETAGAGAVAVAHGSSNKAMKSLEGMFDFRFEIADLRLNGP